MHGWWPWTETVGFCDLVILGIDQRTGEQCWIIHELAGGIEGL